MTPPSGPQTTSAPPRVAVVGAGAWGVNHIRVFSELGALAVICDADPLRLEALEPSYPETVLTSSLPEALHHPDVAGVVVATPAVTHRAVTTEVLAAGKDALVEKPLALDVAEAEGLRAHARRVGCILAVGHVLEYHPAVQRLRDLVGSGDLGRVRYLYSNRLNFGTIRTEENVLWSFAPHDIAIMLRLLHRQPRSVTCAGGSYLDPSVPDATLTSLEFPGDVRAHIYVSWLHPFKEQRFVVVGDQRMAVFDDTAPWAEKLVTYEHSVDWAEGRVPIARKVAPEAIAVTEREPLRLQAEAFLEAMRSRQAPIADAEDAIAVLRVLKAAQRSLDGGGVPVALDLVGEIHHTATIDPGAIIGDGTRVWHQTHVMPDAVIGGNCTLGQNVFVGRGVRIGDDCKIQNNVSVYEGVTLERGVFCGPSMVFTNVRNPRADVDRREDFDATLVREGATIGANSTIVCGTTIGRYAFVGAGAVVTGDVPNHALVVGSPAEVKGWVCRCGERLPDVDEPTCVRCGERYRRGDAGMEPL